jgi:hypothetical protein
MTIDSATPFATGAKLEITLTLRGNQDPKDPLVVVVGGVKARQVGSSNVYEINSSRPLPEPDGTLAIVVQ